ncbi:thiazole biosynthesis protein ThiJ [Bacteroidia bacterium]|nr:thiazole biosynthesis protein ThiJ [Bacteroidia bacterium]
MKKVFVFLAEGFEEIEAVATIDIIRRGGIEVSTVSVSGKLQVTGAHEIAVSADLLFEQAELDSGDMLVLPGGMPGAANLKNHSGLGALLKQYATNGKKIAAICAAPLVLGDLGLLRGKKAVVYPGYEDTLQGAELVQAGIVKDGNIITGKGPGFVFDFGFAIVEELLGKSQANTVAANMLLR